MNGAGAGTTTGLQFNGSPTSNAPWSVAPGTNGIVNVSGTGKLTNKSVLQSVAAPGGEVHFKLDIDNQGSIVWDGSTFLDKANGSYVSGGQLSASGASPLIVSSGGTLKIAGSGWGGIDVIELSGAHLTVDAGTLGLHGCCREARSISGTATHVVSAGSYQQDATSSMTMRIGGTGNGQFDQLASSGATTLAGTLNLSTVSPFVGGLCRQLVNLFANQSSLSGSFSTINGRSLAPTRSGAWCTCPAASRSAVLIPRRRSGSLRILWPFPRVAPASATTPACPSSRPRTSR
ncbi:MAG: hypothetical protein U0163_11835 [Gemmatimonadaceae bacterium]